MKQITVIIPFGRGTTFHSHENHNPDCDIIVGHIDADTDLTYGIYVKGPKKGEEFCEYYSGENYCPESRKRSYSKLWKPVNIPIKYYTRWQLLRSIYQELPTVKKDKA
jgi:hypothetical protein